MSFVRVFIVHYTWFILFCFLTFFSRLTRFYIFYTNSSLLFSFPLFSTSTMDLKATFLLDSVSSPFMRVVLLISTIIIIYSFNYISPYSKPSYFLWLTVLFVTSMLLVISMPNLFFAILGWDGLGLVSFFLIVYYQNQSSIVSGVFTLLINRIGDRFFLCRLILMFYFSPDFTFFSSDLPSFLVVTMLVLTFITKRALYPFSPWLPLAIAAPTPISALVHSSTLVTAGLYLIIRFNYVLYRSPEVLQYLFIARIFTSFYAGINTMFEVDLKKLIALSTLSHLGFIGIAFSIGLLYLRFFHLLVHALFKSLLFITIGDIMINLNHAQDARYLSGGYFITPFSVFIISVSLLNLLGMPRVRGFFSKDLVLETLSYSNASWFIELVLYVNVFFTYYYTYKLFYFSFSSTKLNAYQLHHSVVLTHVALITGLALSTLFFSSLFMGSIFSYVIFYSLPLTVKFLPLLINLRVFGYLFVFIALPTIKTKLASNYGSSMLFLSNITLTFSSNTYYSLLFNSVKSTELGLINYSLNTQFTKPINSLSASLIASLYKVQSTVLSVSMFVLFIVFLSLFILLNNISLLYMTVTHNIS